MPEEHDVSWYREEIERLKGQLKDCHQGQKVHGIKKRIQECIKAIERLERAME